MESCAGRPVISSNRAGSEAKSVPKRELDARIDAAFDGAAPTMLRSVPLIVIGVIFCGKNQILPKIFGMPKGRPGEAAIKSLDPPTTPPEGGFKIVGEEFL